MKIASGLKLSKAQKEELERLRKNAPSVKEDIAFLLTAVVQIVKRQEEIDKRLKTIEDKIENGAKPAKPAKCLMGLEIYGKISEQQCKAIFKAASQPA